MIGEWHKIDLHIHAEHGITFDGSTSDGNANYYSLYNMIVRNKINDLALVALTEHNLVNVINNLKLSYALNLAMKGESDCLPGVELDLLINQKRYHVIIIFSKRVDIIKISFNIKKFISNKGHENRFYLTLEELLKVIMNTECIIIPHACKISGLKKSSQDEVESIIATGIIDILRSGNFINFLFEHTKDYFKGSFAKSVLESASVNWISEDEIIHTSLTLEAGIAGSDFRFTTDEQTISNKDFSAIWAEPTFRGLELVCMFPKNRILLSNQVIKKNNYISRIQINENEYFSDSNIMFSSGLNSIIGSSASGKTTLLHIIANKLGGKSIRDKKYNFTDDLLVSFFDKDENPINLGDIKIEVAESLYEKISTIHESDVKGILNLFNYSINQKSTTIKTYENKIKSYIDLETQFLSINKGLVESIIKLNENTKNYVLNIKGNQSTIIKYTIVSSSSGRVKIALDELVGISDVFKVMSISIVDLKSQYESIKFILSKYYNKDEFSELIVNLENELIKIKYKLNYEYLKLKKEQYLQANLNRIIGDFNSNIGQKSEYVQRLNKNITSSKDELIRQLRNVIVLEKRKKLINLDFPSDQLVTELTNSNRNDYLDLEIILPDDLFKVGTGSGIIEYEKNSTVLKEFKDEYVFESNRLKELITAILRKNGNPIFRQNELIDITIKNSNLKLGYPGHEKIDINDVSPGDASKIFIDYKFKMDFKNGNFNVVLFDQPENDVDKEFIYQELLKQINDLKHETQVILTSHDPLIVINGDSNRIINAEKKNKKISYSSSSLENYTEGKPITSLVSRFVDGDELAVKKRYELYTGGNAKW